MGRELPFENGDMDPALVAKRLEIHQAEDKRLRAELKRRTAITELPAHIGSDANIERVQRELRSMIKTSTPGSIREYLRIILDKIIVNGYELEIHGYSAGVMATLAVNKDDNAQGVTRVSVEVDKWQPVCRANANFKIRANIRRKILLYKDLPENPIRMAQWLQAMLDTGQAPSKTALCHLAGVSRARVIQYLNLLSLPPDYVFPLRYFDGLQEGCLRPLVGVGVERQKQGLNRVINRMGGAVLEVAG